MWNHRLCLHRSRVPSPPRRRDRLSSAVRPATTAVGTSISLDHPRLPYHYAEVIPAYLTSSEPIVPPLITHAPCNFE